MLIYLVNQFTRMFDQMRNIADIIATGQRVAEINKFCQKQTESTDYMQENAFFISDSVNSGDSKSLGPTGDNRSSHILGRPVEQGKS